MNPIFVKTKDLVTLSQHRVLRPSDQSKFFRIFPRLYADKALKSFIFDGSNAYK
jgi:hypothetical protein